MFIYPHVGLFWKAVRRHDNAYARAYALYFAKVACATLWNPGFCLRAQIIYDTALLKGYAKVSDDAYTLQRRVRPSAVKGRCEKMSNRSDSDFYRVARSALYKQSIAPKSSNAQSLAQLSPII